MAGTIIKELKFIQQQAAYAAFISDKKQDEYLKYRYLDL